MLVQMHSGSKIEHIRNSVGVGFPSAQERARRGAGDQAVEGFVQWCARSCGAVGERRNQVYPLEVIAPQADTLRGCGGADALVSRVAEVRAARDIGQGSVDNQSALPC